MHRGYEGKPTNYAQDRKKPISKKEKEKPRCASCGRDIKPEEQRCKIKVGHKRVTLCIDCGTILIDQMLAADQKDE